MENSTGGVGLQAEDPFFAKHARFPQHDDRVVKGAASELHRKGPVGAGKLWAVTMSTPKGRLSLGCQQQGGDSPMTNDSRQSGLAHGDKSCRSVPGPGQIQFL